MKRRRGERRGRSGGTYDDIYYRDLAACDPMTVEEERGEAKRLAELVELLGEPPYDRNGSQGELVQELIELRRRFVRSNLRLVVKIAAQYQGAPGEGRIPLSDLVQEGNLGLLTAIERFDPDRGVRFCTYAAWWIRHRVSRACHNHGRPVRIPTHIAQTASKVKRARRSLEAERRTPDLDSMARRAGVSSQRARTALDATRSGLSLEMPVSEDGARTLRDTIMDDLRPIDEDIADRERLEALTGALAKLRPLELDILRQRFAFDADEPVTLRELGKKHKLSRERVRQLQNAALRRLRDELSAHDQTAA